MSKPTLVEQLQSEFQRVSESGEQYAHITKLGVERILNRIDELEAENARLNVKPRIKGKSETEQDRVHKKRCAGLWKRYLMYWKHNRATGEDI